MNFLNTNGPLTQRRLLSIRGVSWMAADNSPRKHLFMTANTVLSTPCQTTLRYSRYGEHTVY
jgi:hypothetical protein